MHTPVMNLPQQPAQAPASARRFSLHPQSQSVTVRTGRRPSLLVVQTGCVWVTLPGSRGEEGRDLWLHAGECLALAPNQTLWVDGWPQAELQLQPVPQAVPSPGVLRGLLAWTRRHAPSRSVVAAPLPCCGA